MAVGALIVAIVAALGAVGAAWFARRQAKTAGDALEEARQATAAAQEAAVASERSAIAAEAGMALETSRRHEELTPRFRVTVTRSGKFAMLSVILLGPPELGRLDGLTVTIRDTEPWPPGWKERDMRPLRRLSNLPRGFTDHTGSIRPWVRRMRRAAWRRVGECSSAANSGLAWI